MYPTSPMELPWRTCNRKSALISHFLPYIHRNSKVWILFMSQTEKKKILFSTLSDRKIQNVKIKLSTRSILLLYNIFVFSDWLMVMVIQSNCSLWLHSFGVVIDARHVVSYRAHPKDYNHKSHLHFSFPLWNQLFVDLKKPFLALKIKSRNFIFWLLIRSLCSLPGLESTKYPLLDNL